MAAGAILVPAAGALANDALPSLEDVQPFITESEISEEDADFYQRVADGLPVVFDFDSVVSADNTVVSEPSEPTVSEPSDPTISEPSEPSDSEPSVSEPSEPSISEPSEPSISEPSEPSI